MNTMELWKTDGEFMERFKRFAFDEVVNEPGQGLDPQERWLAILAALMGCGGVDAFTELLPRALDDGLSPVMVKEAVYQATDYLGYGRMLPFLMAANQILEERGVALPLPSQATTYTRTGLDLRQRELITFCFIMAQGGCEPQLIAHAKGNMNMGNDKNYLIRVVSQCVPYIGYPRSLNALSCIEKAAE